MIDDYLDTTATIVRRGGNNVYGEATGETTTTVAARVQQRMQLVRTPEGKEVVSDSMVYLPAGTTIGAGDRITTADGQTYQVMAIRGARGLGYDSHVVAYLGATSFGA